MQLFLISSAVWLVSLIPPRFAEVVARPLAWMVWMLSRRLRTVSMINIGLCFPQLDEHERKRMARESLVHYVRSGFELGISWYWSPERSRRLFLERVGFEAVEAAAAHGKGVVCLCPHIAAWELMTQELNDVVKAALYKPAEHQQLEQKIIKNRERYGITMLPANRRGLRALYEVLREGSGVVILPDQEPTLGAGEFAPFFDAPALTGILAPRMIRKTGARAVFVACIRQPKGRYQVHFIPAHEDIYSEDLELAAAAVNRGVEQTIALAPSQYLWAYKRFRARPEGQPRLY